MRTPRVETALFLYWQIQYESRRLRELRRELDYILSQVTPDELVEYLRGRSLLDAGNTPPVQE